MDALQSTRYNARELRYSARFLTMQFNTMGVEIKTVNPVRLNLYVHQATDFSFLGSWQGCASRGLECRSFTQVPFICLNIFEPFFPNFGGFSVVRALSELRLPLP